MWPSKCEAHSGRHPTAQRDESPKRYRNHSNESFEVTGVDLLDRKKNTQR